MQEDDKQEQPGVIYSPGTQIQPTAPEPTLAQSVQQVQPPAPVEAPAPAPVAEQPQASPAPAPTPAPQAPEPVAPAPQPQIPEPTAPAPVQVQSSEPFQESGFYSPPASASPAPTQTEGVSWTASEYVSNPKNSGWFMLLGLLTIVVCAVVYLVTRDVISTVVIGMLGVIVGIFAARQPHVLEYRIDGGGIQIGPKYYAYNAFKAFTVAEEHAIGYVSLLPLKRFMTPIIIHYAPDDEESILNTLADYLPYEDQKTDVVESISRRFRF